MFNRILIANRGEIACRIIATCRRLGIETVGVYSSVDGDARHVRLADHAVKLGPAAASESYLRADRIIAAAQALGAQAVHPGYGFLAENAEFARAVAAAGLAFIGPKPATIERMGSKIAAKLLMREAGVPVVPGYDGAEQDDTTLAAQANEIGFPLLIKASAGGGGKGMRIVTAAAEFPAALAGARREAQNAFGDQTVLLEKYLSEPRHIEVQVFADTHGHIVHLHERECSIQRRHQKIIEEAPAPNLDAGQRSAIHKAAVAAARAVGYVNAGTVEFIMDAGGEFYFMEMNTRLQVEHPVTELVTGLDLVEWQLRVAAGESLPAAQSDIGVIGHALEARIYAEDPGNGFLPATGRIERFDYPQDADVRMDTGVNAGDVIGIHYDPMVAKLCVHGPDRGAALDRLRAALARCALIGCRNNLSFLHNIAIHPDFAAGRMHTAYVDTHLDDLTVATPTPKLASVAAASLVMLGRRTTLNTAKPCWSLSDGWQSNGRSVSRLRFIGATGEIVVAAHVVGDGFEFDLDDATIAVRAARLNPTTLVLTADGRRSEVFATRAGPELRIGALDQVHSLRLESLYPVARAASDEDAHPRAPMPGTIVALHVAEGEAVEAGQPLLVMEGMKMEHTVKAARAGTIAALRCAEGDMVDAEAPLMDINTD